MSLPTDYWFNLALLAAILFAWVTIIDKLMVDRNFTDPFMYSLFIRLYGLISATAFVLLAGGWQSLSVWAIGPAMLAGALKIGSGAIYFSSLARGDASLISAVAQTRPLFALLWGVGLLGERLDPLAYLGVTIIVLGTMLLSIERDHTARKALRLNRVVPLMLLSNVFHSLAGLSLKVALREATPENGYFWEVVGGILVGGAILCFWSQGRARMRSMLVRVEARALAGSAFNEIIANIGGLVLAAALSVGPLSGVITLNATQPLFISPFIWIATQLRPGLVAGENKGQTFIPRWTVILFLIMGIYILGG